MKQLKRDLIEKRLNQPEQKSGLNQMFKTSLLAGCLVLVTV